MNQHVEFEFWISPRCMKFFTSFYHPSVYLQSVDYHHNTCGGNDAHSNEQSYQWPGARTDETL